MATEDRFEVKEMIKRVKVNMKLLQTVISGLRAAKNKQEAIFARGGTAAEIKEVIVDTALFTLEAIKDEAADSIAAFRFAGKPQAWARVLRVGNPFELHSFAIDVSSKTIGFLDIEGNLFDLSTAPFHLFSDPDVLEISNASNSAMNGRYTTSACTVQVLTLNETIPGSDIANEKNMIITLKEETIS